MGNKSNKTIVVYKPPSAPAQAGGAAAAPAQNDIEVYNKTNPIKQNPRQRITKYKKKRNETIHALSEYERANVYENMMIIIHVTHTNF